MMHSTRALALKRSVIAATLLALAFSLTGCVYLRLLKFKNQLREWESHVQVQHSPQLSLNFAKPVLRNSDFTFITESNPTRRYPLNDEQNTQIWEWTFEKEQSAEESTPFRIDFITRFENALLVEIAIDPKLTEAIPKPLVTALFKSMGKAKINTLGRSATAVVDTRKIKDTPIPTLESIASVMGEPTRQKEGKKRSVWQYTFNFYNPENGSLSGQFRIDFRGDPADPSQAISGFQVTGKAN